MCSTPWECFQDMPRIERGWHACYAQTLGRGSGPSGNIDALKRLLAQSLFYSIYRRFY